MPTDNTLWIPPLSPKDQKRLNGKQQHQWQKGVRWFGKWMSFSGKTFWDLLSIIAIPVVIAAGTLWFSAQQSQAGVQASDRQHQTDLQIAKDQQQENALQTYLDRMSDLLLNSKLRESELGDEVRNVARARTITVLPQLDGIRKGQIVQFLYEAGLIDQKNVIVDLAGADLSHASLVAFNLVGADLNGTNLYSASLSYAKLNGANLNNTMLFDADLSSAYLDNTNLSNALLYETNLSGANLSHANLTNATLEKVNLTSTNLTDADLAHAFLSNANLTNTNLTSANLRDASLLSTNLSHANLSHANLIDANLSLTRISGDYLHIHITYIDCASLIDANLSSADLKGVLVSDEQLKQVKSLKGATMPNGSKHL